MSETLRGRLYGGILLIALLTFCAAMGWFMQQHWPAWQQLSVSLQRQLHQSMTLLLRQVAEETPRAGAALALFSFIYGVLHALGPGHGKVVIVTYLATHPVRWRQSVRLAVAASLLQGMVAIALVSIVLAVLRLSSRYLHLSSFWLEKGSYALVALLGIALCIRAVRQILRHRRKARATLGMRISALQPLAVAPIHSADCGCGHQHVPDDRQVEQAVAWQTRLALVAAMGLRPCSGAILVLLFSKVIGAYEWGIAAALAMAAGTALTITLIALLVHSARRLAQRMVGTVWQKRVVDHLAPLVLLIGGTLLLIVGVLLYQGTVPDGGGLRPFGRSSI